MNLSTLTALSPLDGRYHNKVADLRAYFSEFALIRYRVKVEIEWLKALAREPAIAEVPTFSAATFAQLDALANNFSEADAQAVKDIEKTTNHDVKAVEYWMKDRLAGNAEVMKVSEFIHFACTSEDINNLSHGLMLKDAREAAMLPGLAKVVARLTELAHELATMPMLAHTHGQPASPTTVGKEMANVAYRLQRASKSAWPRSPFWARPMARWATTTPICRPTPISTGSASRSILSKGWGWISTPTPSRSNRTTAWPSCSTPTPAPTPS